MNYYGSMKNPESLITREFLSQIVGTTTYDPSVTYNNGDFCFYDTTGKTYIDSLWRCSADNTTGAWDATKWEELDILSLFPHSLHIDLNELVDTATIAKIQANTEGMCYVTFDNKVVDAFNLVPTYKAGTATYYKTAANYFVTCEPGATPVINYTDPAMYEPASPADMLSHSELILQAGEFFYDDQVYFAKGDTAKIYAYHTQDSVTTDFLIDVTNNAVHTINIDAVPFMRQLPTFFNTFTEEKLYDSDDQKEFAAMALATPTPALVAVNGGGNVVDFWWATSTPNTYSNGKKTLAMSADGIQVTFNAEVPAMQNTTYTNHAEPSYHIAYEPNYFADGILTFEASQIPVYDKVDLNVPYVKFTSPAAFTITSPKAVLFSTDGVNWSSTAPAANTTIFVRAETPYAENFGTFAMTGDNITVSGNITSLTTVSAKAMFKDCPIIAYNADIPQFTDVECYANMFEGTKLATCPVLPEPKSEGCFKEMFKDALITELPNLSYNSLPDSCYVGMFKGCPIEFDTTGTPYTINYYNTPITAFTDFATNSPEFVANTIYYYEEV